VLMLRGALPIDNHATALLRAADSQSEMVWQVAGSDPSTTPHTETSAPLKKFKGVSKSGSKWRVLLRIDGKLVDFGTYESAIDAALARDRHAPANRPSWQQQGA
jgi:hypothetical protein